MFQVLCGILESVTFVNETFQISGDSHLTKLMDDLPSTWLFETLVDDDEDRYNTIAMVYLHKGRLDLLWDDLERAENWLIKRLRSKKVTRRDYINFGHCCWLLHNDKLMAYENYRTARLMYNSAKEFFADFRPDRHFLAEKEIPLEHIYMMEDQLLSISEN